MDNLLTATPTDTWVTATWEDYLRSIADLAHEQVKGYYHNGRMRLEMQPIGPDHAGDNSLVDILIALFGIAKGIQIKSLVNCSYRKTGIRECQPDASYYIGERVRFSPQGSAVVNLDSVEPPDLIIEVSDSSLLDDLGTKRMLYEDLGIAEYWVLDVQQAKITAFKMIANQGSYRITQSQVLPGLHMALLEAGLQRSRQADNTQVGTWFLAQV